MNYVCVYALFFSDGGEPEFQVLHKGSEADCKSIADLIPAVSYSGPRPVKTCRMGIFPMPPEPLASASQEPGA